MAWTVLRKFLPAAVRSTDGREAERVFHDCIFAGMCCGRERWEEKVEGGMLMVFVRLFVRPSE